MLGIAFSITPIEWIAVAICVVAGFALECVNTEEGLVRLGNDVKLYTRLLISLRDMLERPQPEFETAMSGDTVKAKGVRMPGEGTLAAIEPAP